MDDSVEEIIQEENHDDDDDDGCIYSIGTKISRKFNDGQYYDGKITSHDDDSGWYKIKYDDGDEEEFDNALVKRWLKKKSKKSKSKKRKAKRSPPPIIEAIKEEKKDNDGDTT
ncbi:MAG: hypothetical protein ACI8RD_009030, partial [Bacillariaceae sp.]